jgi:hypothetical protein
MLTLLHLLRERPREVRIITMLFWTRAAETPRARTLWQKFRHPLTFVLLTLTCGLLAVATGRPQSTRAWANARSEIIILDAGVSMGARPADASASRLDLARREIDAELQQLTDADRVTVLVADPFPRVVLDREEPVALARTKLQSLQSATTPALRRDALRLAHSMLSEQSGPSILLVTDRPVEPEFIQHIDPGIRLRVKTVGTAASNVDIVSAVFNPLEANPLRGTLTVRLLAAVERPLDVRVTVKRARGEVLLDRHNTLSPGDTPDFAIGDLAADGDRLTIHLDVPDALAADNQAVFRLPLRRLIRIAAPTDLPAPLLLALRSDPAIRMVQPNDPCDLQVNPTDGWNGPSIIVPAQAAKVDGTAPLRTAARHPLLRDLSFDGAVANDEQLESRAIGGETLLSCGSLPVVSRLGPSPAAVRIDPALWSPPLLLHRQAAFAVLVARVVRRLAGWQDGPITLTCERASIDPLWTVDQGLGLHNESRLASRTSLSLTPDPTGHMASEPMLDRLSRGPVLAEWLLLLGLAGFIIDTLLHTRGRIS